MPRRLAGTSEADPVIMEPHRSKRGSVTRTLHPPPWIGDSEGFYHGIPESLYG